MKRMRKLLLAAFAFAFCFFAASADASAAEAKEIKIPVTINLTGAVPTAAEDFIIEVRGENETTPMPEGTVDGVYSETVTSGTEESLDMTITYNSLGVYNYTITQKAGANPNCTYDDSVYHMKVTVTNASEGDGYAVTVALRKDGVDGKVDGIIFDNFYIGDVDIELGAVKYFNGVPALPGTFGFVLIDDHGKIVDTTVNGLYGKIKFDELTFDKEGTYHYQIREIIGVDPLVVYDATVYDVYIVVTMGEEGYETDVVIKRNGLPYCGIPVFYNKTRKPVDVDIDADKFLDGKVPTDGQFEFAIIDKDGNIVTTAKNDQYGQIHFDDLTFYAPGIYKYKVVEVAGDDETIIYDDTEYEVTITVTPNLPIVDGYNAKVVITVDGELHTGKLTFNNTTVPEKPEDPVIPDDPEDPVVPEDPEDPVEPEDPVIDEPIDEPEDPVEEPEDSDTVKTGDNANFGLYIGAMFLAVAAIIAVLVAKRFRKN